MSNSNSHINLLFAQPFWLNAVAGEATWKRIASPNGDEIVFHFRKNKLFNTLVPALLTPYTVCTSASQNLFSQLPDFDFAEIYLHPAFPFQSSIFKNNNFEVTEKHTCVLELNNEADLFKNFKPTLQRQIKKAEKLVHISESKNTEAFFQLLQTTFEKRKADVPFTKTVLKSVMKLIAEKQCGCVLQATDEQNKIHAMGLFVWDEFATYYLAGGINDAHKQSGAMSFLLWNAIQKAKAHSRNFDFCGSTIPSIDKFFETFNAEKMPVKILKKEGNLLFQTALKGYKLFKK